MDENVLIQVNHVSMCFHLASERFDIETFGVFLILVLYVYFFFRFLKRLFSR